MLPKVNPWSSNSPITSGPKKVSRAKIPEEMAIDRRIIVQSFEESPSPIMAEKRAKKVKKNKPVERRISDQSDPPGYIPKKADLTGLSPEDLDAIVEEINGRPRKCLNYETPYEAFTKELKLIKIPKCSDST